MATLKHTHTLLYTHPKIPNARPAVSHINSQRAFNIGGFGVEHGLDRHRCATANGDIAHKDLSGHKINP